MHCYNIDHGYPLPSGSSKSKWVGVANLRLVHIRDRVDEGAGLNHNGGDTESPSVPVGRSMTDRSPGRSMRSGLGWQRNTDPVTLGTVTSEKDETSKQHQLKLTVAHRGAIQWSCRDLRAAADPL